MTKSETFKAAHAAARRAVAEQVAIKHPSAHKTYAQLFALSLRGLAILAKGDVGGYNATSCMTLSRSQREQIGA